MDKFNRVKISGFAEKILLTPSFIKKLEDYELEELGIHIKERKDRVLGIVSDTRRIPGQDWFTVHNVAEWADLERLETALRLEFQRRELETQPNNEFKLNNEEALEFRRDVMKRGKAYHLLWDEYRRAFGEIDLSEERFLIADIDLCQTKIEELKYQTGSFIRQLVALFKEIIRRHKERLEEIREFDLDKQHVTFERLFIGKNEMEAAISAVEGTVFDANKRPHIRAFYRAAVECKLIKDRRGKERHALPLIALQFGGHCHGNAVYQTEPDEKIVDLLTRRMHVRT